MTTYDFTQFIRPNSSSGHAGRPTNSETEDMSLNKIEWMGVRGSMGTHGDLQREPQRETMEHQNAEYCKVIPDRTKYLNMASVRLTHSADACNFCVFSMSHSCCIQLPHDCIIPLLLFFQNFQSLFDHTDHFPEHYDHGLQHSSDPCSSCLP